MLIPFEAAIDIMENVTLVATSNWSLHHLLPWKFNNVIGIRIHENLGLDTKITFLLQLE